MSRRARVLALSVALATACSWMAVPDTRPAPAICEDSYVPPILDSAFFALSTFVVGATSYELATCDTAPERCRSTTSLGYIYVIPALLFGLSARHGYREIHRCRNRPAIPSGLTVSRP